MACHAPFPVDLPRFWVQFDPPGPPCKYRIFNPSSQAYSAWFIDGVRQTPDFWTSEYWIELGEDITREIDGVNWLAVIWGGLSAGLWGGFKQVACDLFNWAAGNDN